ncbi:MAG: NADH:ubiquinone reductase (Na(+)-transporting) subunit C [Prevotella sp.]|nr:NADH:ubiquinone reductase (Na(+)-transporting) subunit C [Prevotella sp.]
MKNFSNRYIFIYSAALVTVVAVLLALVAMSLKDRQDANIRNEKMQTLLAAIDVQVSADQAEDNYKKYFKKELTVSTDGAVITDYDVATVDAKQADRAFNVKLKDQQKKEKAEQGSGAFPIYVFEKNGRIGYVIPTQGNGLWGAVYSNIALDEDFNTVIGVTFSHDSETPGLGDKITTPEFQQPFIGKTILDENGTVVSIAVKKHADKNGTHEVDAITGGTMTSNGVNEMLAVDLKRYQNFISNTLGNTQVALPDEDEEFNVPVEDIAIDLDANETNEGKEVQQ